MFFTFSIWLTFLNNSVIKVTFSLAYPYPLSITFTHLLLKFGFAWFLRGILWNTQNKKCVELPWRDYVLEVSPTGIASALDIGLSNWSFEFITISLYGQFVKASFSIPIVAIVLSISTGLFMFTYESTQFDLKGFTLVLIASALSGIRWTTAQKVTQQSVYGKSNLFFTLNKVIWINRISESHTIHPALVSNCALWEFCFVDFHALFLYVSHTILGLSDPIDVIYHTQPWMALVLLPLAFGLEGDEFLTSPFLFRSHDYLGTCRTLGYFVFGACLAFGLEVAEFLVVCNSSSLTLSIAGIFKEVVTLYLAAAVNGDQYSPTNIAGLVICLAGISLHVAIRFFKHTAILRFLLCQNRQMTHLPKKLRPGRLTSLPRISELYAPSACLFPTTLTSVYFMPVLC
uniref:Solute carrier family 35 member C2 n=1 Tax=Echinococcus canadensis TaxID=519352 RepID=A0A915EW67_9CEST